MYVHASMVMHSNTNFEHKNSYPNKAVQFISSFNGYFSALKALKINFLVLTDF